MVLIGGAQDGVGVLKLLLDLPSSLDSPIPEGVISALCYHMEALEMLNLLEKEKGFEGPITEMMVCCAAASEFDGPSVIEYLAQLSQEPLPVSERVLIQAARNYKKGAQVIKALMSHSHDASFTDAVFEEACKNKDVMLALLNENRRPAPMKKILMKISSGASSHRNASDLKDTFQALLERQLIDVDESLVELMTANFACLDALISWKPDAPITEQALCKAAMDPRSMRVMMAAQGSSSPITDNVLLSAARSYDPVHVMEVIFHRQNSLRITETLIVEAAAQTLHTTVVRWLLNQQTESFVTNFWENIWMPGILDGTFQPAHSHIHPHFHVITVFLEKTGSGVTETMLEEWPYKQEPWVYNYDIETFVEFLCTRDDYPDVPSTERAAEIVMERCPKHTIALFLEHTQVPVTEKLIQAADKNLQPDKEELMTFLGELKADVDSES